MDELAKRMMDLAEKVGPDAMAAARGAVRVEAYSTMASAVVCIIAAVACYKGASYLWWSYVSASNYSMGEPKFFAGILFLAAGILAWMAIWSVIDPWTWTALNNPDLWLAKKILKL